MLKNLETITKFIYPVGVMLKQMSIQEEFFYGKKEKSLTREKEIH